MGESERAVRQLFSRARAAAPCVLFFDELDALAPRRGSDTVNQSSERVVNQVGARAVLKGGLCWRVAAQGAGAPSGAHAGRRVCRRAGSERCTRRLPSCCTPEPSPSPALPPTHPPAHPPTRPQLLTEMDGIEGRAGVYLVAATNRPDMIDPALLRPGRLDKILYVPLPPPEGRASILRALTRRTPMEPGLDLDLLGGRAELAGFSGADLAALVREACVLALKERIAGGLAAVEGRAAAGAGGGVAAGAAAGPPLVCARHFEAAARRVQPSVSRKDQRMYDALRLRLRSARGHLRPEDDAGGATAAPTEAAGAPPADAGGPADMSAAEGVGGGGEGAPMDEDPVAQPA